MWIKNRDVYLSIFMAVLLVFGLVLVGQKTVLVNKATEGSWRNFREWFPREELIDTRFLTMDEASVSNPQTKAQLHFKVIESDPYYMRFKMFNTYPPEECHWDLFEWSNWSLKYIQTHNGCGGANEDTIFDPPIVFMPQYWLDSTESPFWENTGVSTHNVYKDGQLICRGTNTYVNKFTGWTKLTPTYDAFGWQTDQTTVWENRNNPRCGGGQTNWREQWYFGGVPVEGAGSVFSFKRSIGGNIDRQGYPDWDVWSLAWKKKPGSPTPPWLSPTPEPQEDSDPIIETPTPAPTRFLDLPEKSSVSCGSRCSFGKWQCERDNAKETGGACQINPDCPGTADDNYVSMWRWSYCAKFLSR